MLWRVGSVRTLEQAMPMSDPETTDLPILDGFRGPEGLLELSQRLMDWYNDPVSDQDIADVLGEHMIPAFRYAQERLEGKVRKVTLEPAFCHSADVAFRAVELGYGDEVVKACFLHDVVEDTSKTIADMPRAVSELAEQFGDPVLRDVKLLTNRYQLIFKQMRSKVSPRVELSARGVYAFRSALDVVYYELPEAVASTYMREFQRMAALFEGTIDLSEAVKVARRDKKFTLSAYLERLLYPLYVEDLVEDASSSAESTEGRGAVTPLVVKYMDVIDNVRTSEVSNRLSLYKLVRKAETVIDTTQRLFINHLPAELAARTTIPTLHRIVQIRLVDQFKIRRRALADNFSETRFATLIGFLSDQAQRLNTKYDVPRDRVDRLNELEDRVRHWNHARRNKQF